jgi:TolB-like protein
MRSTVVLGAAAGSLVAWLASGQAAGQPKLAVMEIRDQTHALSVALLEGLTDSLRTTLTRSGRFVVIDRSRQAAALKKLVDAQKKESYKPCYDSGCQIPLGQALAADSVLRTKVTRLGSLYLATAELVDLEKETVTSAAQVQIPALPDRSRDERLLQAVLTMARQLVGSSTPPGGADSPAPPSPVPRLRLGGAAPMSRQAQQIAPPRVGRPEPIQARDERAGQQARLERERLDKRRLAVEAKRAEVAAANVEINARRAVRSDWAAVTYLFGSLTGPIGLGLVFVKAENARDPDDLERAHEIRVAGGVLLGLSGALTAAGVLLTLTAPKLIKEPVEVAGLELDQLPSVASAGAQATLVSWGGRF